MPPSDHHPSRPSPVTNIQFLKDMASYWWSLGLRSLWFWIINLVIAFVLFGIVWQLAR